MGRLWVYVLAFCPARFLLCFLFTHWQRVVKELSVHKNALNPALAHKRALYSTNSKTRCSSTSELQPLRSYYNSSTSDTDQVTQINQHVRVYCAGCLCVSIFLRQLRPFSPPGWMSGDMSLDS